MGLKKIDNFRALIVKDDFIIGSKGYSIYKFNIVTDEMEFIARVDSFINSVLSRISFTRRLFRAEITNLYNLNDGSELLIAKKGIYRRPLNSSRFIRSFSVPRGTRPMNLCVTPDGEIFFGEYFNNIVKEPVNIYSSLDNGLTWKIKFTFPKGSINHIHGIFYDSFVNYIWIVTGDRDDECIIGYTDDGFATFHEVFRGGQEFRCCNLFFFKDQILFATDSQYIENEIKSFNRKTLELKTLYKINGSCIYGGQTDTMVYLSSSIEPSKVNFNKFSSLYISFNNGYDWLILDQFKKDYMPSFLFQFGSIIFPRYMNNKFNLLIFYCRALDKVDGKTLIYSL